MIAVTAFTGDICIIQLQILHCSFEFVKAVGNTISKVQLPKDQEINGRIVKHVSGTGPLYRVYKKKLNKPEIAHQLCKAPQCTKFFIKIGCLGSDNVV